MASVFAACANALQTIVAGVAGAPSLVVVRDTDAFHAGEGSCVIITMGEEYEEKALSGAGTDTDQGDRLMAYQFGFSFYTGNLGLNQTGIETRQDFITACQQAMNKKNLAGVPTVYDTALVRRSAWEPESFKNGVEKSVWGLLVRSAETRLGN